MEEVVVEETEYDTMDLEMLREVVPMLRQQLDKSMLDRNYVQLERVSSRCSFIGHNNHMLYIITFFAGFHSTIFRHYSKGSARIGPSGFC